MADMKRDVCDTHQKAMQINLDTALYGTFAEIGAGQVVARWFSRIGGGSCAIAKTVSTHDTSLGDAIYGVSDDPVSRKRLETMLDQEFTLLVERLTSKRGDRTAFFVFAETILTANDASMVRRHGWMGIRFQTRPLAPASQIILHASLLSGAPGEEAALGILGVNLLHGARNLHSDPEALLVSLLDHLVTEQIEVDFIEFSGQDFLDVDNRLMALKLVEHGLTLTGLVESQDTSASSAGTVISKSRKLPGHQERPRSRRGLRPARGGLIDSVHLAGMPRAA
jgi:hypothetical protein